MQTGFDEPDGVRSSAGYETSDDGSGQVNTGGFLAVVEVVGEDALAVAVRPEVY